MTQQFHPGQDVEVQEVAINGQTIFWRKAKIVGKPYMVHGKIEYQVQFPDGSRGVFVGVSMTSQFHEGQEVEVALAWQNCPSTHCERAQECRSPHECSGWRKARIVHKTKVMHEDMAGYVVQFPDGTRGVFDAEHIRAVDIDAEIAMNRRGEELGASLEEMAKKYDL